jgi:hypothetical protein
MRRKYEVPAHHQRVARALGAGGPALPDHLLRRLEVLEAPRARPRARFLRPAFAAGLAAVLAAVVAVVSSLGGPGMSVSEAAQLSELPSQRATPARSFAGVAYPDWTHAFKPWRKAGGRSDELNGRSTTTVFYRHTHHRIGYTVIAGDTIEPPAGAERITVDGLQMRRFKLGELDVVTFERNGRTCVLAGDVHDPDTLVKLAATELE